MRISSPLLSFLIIASAGTVLAGPMIVVGNHHLAADTPGQQISLLVSGGDAVEGLDFNVQIGDGGAALNGITVAPVITSVDLLTGTIFAGNNTGQVDLATLPLFDASTTTTAGGTVAASGLLATLTIDTTGFFGGSWPLELGATNNGPTDFALISASITDGTISIPEPAGMLLFFFGATILLLARRR